MKDLSSLDYWRTIYYTLEYFLTYALSLDQVKLILERFQLDMISELQINNFASSPLITTAYQFIYSMFGIELHKLNAQLVNDAFQEATKNKAKMVPFIASFAFNMMDIRPRQISNVPLNIANAFSSYLGYSGTLDNTYIFWQHEDKYIDRSEAASIDMQIKGRLESSAVEILLMTAEPDSNDSLIDTLSDLNICGYHALIDVGAIFKDFANRKMAETILDRCKVLRSIVYYDDKHNTLYQMTRPMQISSNQRNAIRRFRTEPFEGFSDEKTLNKDKASNFVYLDQPHTTGTDVEGCQKQKAVVTYSSFNTEKELFQGILRVRKYLSNEPGFDQHIDLALIKEFAEHLSATATYVDVLQHAAEMTRVKVQKEYISVYLQRMEVGAATFARDFIIEHGNQLNVISVVGSAFPASLFLKESIKPPSLKKQTMQSLILDRSKELAAATDIFASRLRNEGLP